MNTPDTEWKSVEEQVKGLTKYSSNVRCSHDNQMVPLKEVVSLLTSRDTYWKERVEEMKYDIEALRGSPRDTDLEYARAITDVHKILDTLLDNLK